jgi:hypothetical protein
MAVLMCGTATSFADPIRAKNTLAEVADTLAGDIQTYLKDKNETAITLGEFVYKGRGQASGGPQVRTALADAFKAKGIDLKLRSNVLISGEYVENEEEGGARRQVVTITTEIKRFKPEEKLTLPLAITNPQAVAVLLGLNVTFPPDATPKERGNQARKAADNPDFGLTGAVVQNKQDARFGVEILVGPPIAVKKNPDGSRALEDYLPRAPDNKEGYAFVPIKREEVYGVILSNEADFEAAVQLRIDGLSMFSFSSNEFRNPKTGKPKYNYIILGPKSRVFIRGWHVTNEVSDEFKITEYAKSAAAELKSSAPTGTITATFHAAWDAKTGRPPADEPPNPDEHSLSADATGKGARFQEKYQEVERKIGVARSVISVRYTK